MAESFSDFSGSMVGGEDDSSDIESSSDLTEQLINATQHGELGKLKYLVEVRHVDPHLCRDDEGDATPLHWAAYCGYLDVVRYLVEERNYNMKCKDRYGEIPLHLAALGGRLHIMRYLISEKGCDPMSRGWHGKTPLHDACQNGRQKVVEYLVEDAKVDASC